MSLPYLRLSNVKCVEDQGWIWLKDRQWSLFPALPVGERQGEYPVARIWAMFKEKDVVLNGHYSFLDWQYLFRPEDFRRMTGRRWEVFRKNCRKWPNRNPGWTYTRDEPSGAEAGILIADWLERKGSHILDGELLTRFAYFEDDSEIFRRYLYNKEGRLVAINAWDENWRYVNYRVCIADIEEPFLDEFVRYLFYTDTQVVDANKWVNDGGSLDNLGLERFKDKMNPVEKIPLYSWIK